MKIPDRVYDILKWIVVIFLPALNGLILGLGVVLGYDSDTVCGVITVVQVFLGALIGVSTITYNKEQNNENNNR